MVQEHDPSARLDRLEAEIAQMTRRLEALEGRPAPSGVTTGATATSDLPDAFWALNALKARMSDAGGVVYAGSVEIAGGHVDYQWGRPTEHLLEADWADRAERASALGHPLRLSILRLLLDGERTVAELVDALDLGSTGVAYHHLNLLHAAGWATSPRRGVWTIPTAAVIPLLLIITALEEG